MSFLSVRNGIPVGVSPHLAIIGALIQAFSPASLFAAGEQGAWYDPSDLTTLFQDSTGTTPVTAVEQPVGLMLDKSKGLVLGSESIKSPYTGSVAGSWSISATSVTRNGTTTAQCGVSFTSVLSATKMYRVSFDVSDLSGDTFTVSIGGANAGNITTNGSKSFILTGGGISIGFIPWNGTSGQATITNISVRELPGNHAYQTTSASRPVLSARYNQYLSTETLATQNVTTLAANYTLTFTGAGSITLSGTATGTYAAGTHTITCTAGTLTSTVSGTVTKADLRVANDGVGIPAYQRVNTSTDYDTTGFPLYLKFDGIDDFLQTNSIDFSSTDKMTVWAGVRKLSDSATSFLVELSASADFNAGAFYLAELTTSGSYQPQTGPVGARTYTPYAVPAAPSSSVIATLLDNTLVGAAQISLRRNGSDLSGTAVVDNGASGNFGNYPLYIGRRGGTTLPFNGRLNSLIIRGAQSTAAQISATETWVNGKTKAYGPAVATNRILTETGDYFVTETGDYFILES